MTTRDVPTTAPPASRRQFLLMVSSCFACGAAVSVFSLRHPRFEALLLRHTAFLTLAPGTARAFAQEHKRRMIAEYDLATWNAHVDALEQGDARFPLATFLLSTDFFLNGADELKTVRYIGYYDPYQGCQNPFARFELEGQG